jgi:hypothetical protein
MKEKNGQKSRDTLPLNNYNNKNKKHLIHKVEMLKMEEKNYHKDAIWKTNQN